MLSHGGPPPGQIQYSFDSLALCLCLGHGGTRLTAELWERVNVFKYLGAPQYPTAVKKLLVILYFSLVIGKTWDPI